MILKQKESWKRLIGNPAYFSLEERIFNSVLIISIVALGLEVPFNFAIGLVVPSMLCLFGMLVASSLYYVSRIKGRANLAIILFCAICHALFLVNFFYNSGLYGPNLLLFSLAFLLTVAVVSPRYFKVWLPINLFCVFAILTVDYFYPDLAPNIYTNKFGKSIDFGVTYLTVVVLTYVAISYIRKNYDDECFTVVEKNIAIEAQRLELEQLNAEKDKLFSIVTHDIRAPLNSIQGYLEVLADADLEESESLLLKQQLLQITRDTSSMLTNLLSWSKTQIEGANAQFVILSVKEALETGLSIEKNISLKKGVKLEVFCEDELHIMADQNMFHLVVRNLVNNAIKFTPVAGSVSVIASKKNNCCSIMIKDNGLGIDQQKQESLFKLKASSTFGTNKERGIGLGLVLCKEFTDLQNGKIWFESNPEGGSIFYLSFDLIAN